MADCETIQVVQDTATHVSARWYPTVLLEEFEQAPFHKKFLMSVPFLGMFKDQSLVDVRPFLCSISLPPMFT